MAEEQGPSKLSDINSPSAQMVGSLSGIEKPTLKAKKGVISVSEFFHKLFGNLFMHVPLQDRVLFARHLAIGIKAGMSIQDALKLIREQTKSKSFKIILDRIILDTANGMFLSASMQQYQGIFGQLFINIVGVGEQSGTLTENLAYLAVELKKKQQMHSKIRGALIYPAVIFCATIGIVITLMVGVFPKILPVFTGLKITLPLSTRILIATTNFMTSNFFFVLLFIALVLISLVVASRYEWFKRDWHRALLRIPIISGISIKINIASISRILGLLLKSGVQIIEAVNITADAIENRTYRKEMHVAAEMLRRGEFFSVYLGKNPRIFPPIFTNMIQVGENTGNLTENLDYLSSFYEEDVDEVLKNLNSIIEPVLLVFMGLLVGFMAISVVTPIYQISASLAR